MPYVTPEPEIAVPAQNANSWAIDMLAIWLPNQEGAVPIIRMGITAETVDPNGTRHLVVRTETELPPAVVARAMSTPIPTPAPPDIYSLIRAAFYQTAQACGLIPASASYQLPPAEG